MGNFEAGTVIARLRLVASDFASGMARAERQTAELRAGLERVSQSFNTIRNQAAVGLASVVGGLALATREGAKFDDALTNVAAITRATSEELAELEKIARSAGATTVFSATEAASAMFNLASQGVKGAQAFDDLLNPILAASAALRRGIEPTAATTLATIKQFGLEFSDASRVVNVFSAANEASTLNLERITDGLKVGGPVAKRFGIDLEEAVAVIGTLTDAGIQATEAGTAFRNILLNLTKTTPKAARALNKAGLGAARIAELIKDPIRLFEELNKAQFTNAELQEIFGKRAFTAAGILIDENKALDKLTKNLKKNTNSAFEIAERQLKSFGNQMLLMKSAIVETALELFRSLEPALRDMVSTLREGFLALATWISENRELVGSIAMWTVGILAAVTVVATLIGSAATLGIAFIGIQAAIGAVLPIMSGLSTALTGISVKMLLLKAGALGAAAAIGISIGNAINKAVKAFPDIDKALSDTIASMTGLLKGVEQARVEIQTDFSKALRQAAKNMENLASVRIIPFRAIEAIEKTGIAFENVSPAIKRAIKEGRTMADVMRALIVEADKLDKALVLPPKVPVPPPAGDEDGKEDPAAQVDQVVTLGDRIREVLGNMDLLMNGIKSLAQGLTSDFTNFFESILTGSKSAADALKALGKAILQSIVRTFAQIIAKILVVVALMALVKALFGPKALNIVAAALGVSDGGGTGSKKLPGKQFGMIPAREDMAVAVQEGEAIITQDAVASLGGAAGVAALNQGQGGGNNINITVPIEAPMGVTPDQVERLRDILSQAGQEFSGGIA